jgi:cobaltochelatase CobT
VIMDSIEEKIEPMDAVSGTQSTQVWAQTLRKIRAGGLRLTLRRLLQRSDYAGREGNLREGRLGRGVARLLNGAENVFDRRYEVDGESVAVSLLIDRSGSMGGQKMEQAAIAALLIGETAQNAGAKLEVVAFDSHYDAVTQGALSQTMMDETQSYGEINGGGKWLLAPPSAVYVCKSFAQSIGHLRRMFTTMRRMANGGTHDASALEWAGKRLLKVDANRKIVFVIADGIGDQTAVFRHVVNGLEQKGVIVIGIGIGCNPKKFSERFTYSVAINDVNDLCAKAFGLLIGTIAKARGIAA